MSHTYWLEHCLSLCNSEYFVSASRHSNANCLPAPWVAGVVEMSGLTERKRVETTQSTKGFCNLSETKHLASLAGESVCPLLTVPEAEVHFQFPKLCSLLQQYLLPQALHKPGHSASLPETMWGFFTCLVVTCVSSLEKCPFESFAHLAWLQGMWFPQHYPKATTVHFISD
jgi:hypothetical protein